MRAIAKGKELPRFLILPIIALLSACQAGPGGNGGATPNFSTYQGQDATIRAAWSGTAYTAPATLPAGGSASYQGVAALDVEVPSGSLAMLGAMTITANFATDAITGTGTGFRDENNALYSGSLALTNGAINRLVDPNSEFTYDGDINGILSGPVAVFTISGTFMGDFYGVQPDATGGVITAGSTSALGSGLVLGQFFAQ